MSARPLTEDERISFAECAGCGHTLAEHETPDDGIGRTCFGYLGRSGLGERLTCSCAAFRSDREDAKP